MAAVLTSGGVDGIRSEEKLNLFVMDEIKLTRVFWCYSSCFYCSALISDCNRGLWGITFSDSDGRNIRRCFSSLRLYKNALFFIYQLLIKLFALLRLSC